MPTDTDKSESDFVFLAPTSTAKKVGIDKATWRQAEIATWPCLMCVSLMFLEAHYNIINKAEV